MLLISFLMLKLELSGAVISGFINFIYRFCFYRRFLYRQKTAQKKFIWGLIVGIFYFVILMIVSLMMNRVGPLPLGNLFTVFITGLKRYAGWYDKLTIPKQI